MLWYQFKDMYRALIGMLSVLLSIGRPIEFGSRLRKYKATPSKGLLSNKLLCTVSWLFIFIEKRTMSSVLLSGKIGAGGRISNGDVKHSIQVESNGRVIIDGKSHGYIDISNRTNKEINIDSKMRSYWSAHETAKPDFDSAIQAFLDSLPKGRIAFNPPPVMQLGTKEIVEVRITRHLDEDLTSGLEGRGRPQIKDIKVSGTMKAQLISDENEFDILPLFKEEEQLIADLGDRRYTEWSWEVTPLKTGNRALYLLISLIIKFNGRQERKDWPVMKEEILVEVTALNWIKAFYNKYWQWIIGTFVLGSIGVGIALWQALK